MLGSARAQAKLFGRGIIFEEFQPMWSRYLIVTDGQTTCNLITALCVASRGKNQLYGTKDPWPVLTPTRL